MSTTFSIAYFACTGGKEYSKKASNCGTVPVYTVVKLAVLVVVVDTRISKLRML